MVHQGEDDVLEPHPPVRLGEAELFVDKQRPVAALVVPSRAVRFVTWPDAALPPNAGPSEVLRAPNSVWVIYREFESFENSGQCSSTAVQIGVDGSCSSTELGNLYPIGADDHGVWLTAQPIPILERDLDEDRDEWNSDQNEFFLRARDAPLEEWDDLPESVPREMGIDFSSTGDGVSFGWTADLTSSGGRGIDLDSEEYAEGLAPQPPVSPPAETGPVTLIRRGLATDEEMTVDRIVSDVEMIDGRLRLTYHPTGPIVTMDPRGTSSSYEYPQETIDVDMSGGLPKEVRVADYPSTTVPSRDWDDWNDARDLEENPVISLAGVAGSAWSLRPLDGHEVSGSLDTVRSELLGLDEPKLVWVAADDQVHRVRSDYRELSVRVENDWPDTEVIAEFAYRRIGEQRVRFRVPLFDAAGRPIRYEFLTVYLMEDVDTMDLDDVEISTDGFIELSARVD